MYNVQVSNLHHVQEISKQMRAYNKARLNFLVKDEDEASKYIYFVLTLNNTVSAINQYQYNKRKRNPISKHKFINLYHQDRQQALETLFQHPISKWDLKRLDNSNRKIEDVYDLSIKNIGYNLINLINDWDILSSNKTWPPRTLADFI